MATEAPAPGTGIDPVCGMTVDPATCQHRFEHGGELMAPPIAREHAEELARQRAQARLLGDRDETGLLVLRGERGGFDQPAQVFAVVEHPLERRGVARRRVDRPSVQGEVEEGRRIALSRFR